MFFSISCIAFCINSVDSSFRVLVWEGGQRLAKGICHPDIRASTIGNTLDTRMSNPRRSRYPLLLPVLGWAHGGNRRGLFFFHIDTFSFSFLGFFIFFFSSKKNGVFFFHWRKTLDWGKSCISIKEGAAFGFFFQGYFSSFLESFSKGWVDKFFFFSVKILLICRFSFEKGINEKAHPKMHKSECNSCWWCIMWL